MIKNLKKKFTAWFKNIVRQTLRENGYTVSYIPYDKISNEFVVAKTKIDYPLCGDGLPLPPKNLRSGYLPDDKKYIDHGKSDLNVIMEIVNRSDFNLEGNKKILDFGCSTGRLMRHLKPYADLCEIWGVDISTDCIYWANSYLNPPFHFATSSLNPHLPFEDRYFDFIYSASVFTHIDNLSEAWLLELRRILSDNGRLYLTIHDNHTLEVLDEHKSIPLASFLHQTPFYEKAKKDYEFFVLNRYKSPLVFFDIDYFKKLLNPMFDILSINHPAWDYQTAILLKRKVLSNKY